MQLNMQMTCQGDSGDHGSSDRCSLYAQLTVAGRLCLFVTADTVICIELLESVLNVVAQCVL
jgi:hypothetical protein